jgi:hypothetical protein
LANKNNASIISFRLLVLPTALMQRVCLGLTGNTKGVKIGRRPACRQAGYYDGYD